MEQIFAMFSPFESDFGVNVVHLAEPFISDKWGLGIIDVPLLITRKDRLLFLTLHILRNFAFHRHARLHEEY